MSIPYNQTLKEKNITVTVINRNRHTTEVPLIREVEIKTLLNTTEP